MSFKSRLIYKLMSVSKNQLIKNSEKYNPATHTLERDVKVAIASRKQWHTSAKLLSLISKAPKDIKQESNLKAGVKCIIARPPDPSGTVILYVHVGFFILDLSSLQTTFAANLAKETRATVWSIDYRVAPEFPFPAGLDDVCTVYKEMLKEGLHPSKIILIGESAGGNLIMALLLKLKQENIPLPAAAIPISPYLDFNMNGETYVTKVEADPLIFIDHEKKNISFSYLRGESPDNPLVSPLLGDLKGLPPLLVLVGGKEVLLSDSISLAEKARQAGVDVILDVHERMFHAYPIIYDFFDEAKVAMGKITLFIQMKTEEGSEAHEKV
jgi:monoterpene epsilon-lactone hydrolase